MNQHPSRILSEVFFKELVAAGVFREDEFVRRVIIDIKQGDAVKLYVERIGDERLLDIARSLLRIEITSIPEPHDVKPLDSLEDGFRCSCGKTFISAAGYAVCPDDKIRAHMRSDHGQEEQASADPAAGDPRGQQA